MNRVRHNVSSSCRSLARTASEVAPKKPESFAANAELLEAALQMFRARQELVSDLNDASVEDEKLKAALSKAFGPGGP